ncbi:MAG: hypothetical protein GWN58_01050 [Anaerolineae bacterium]|nr:hypothetical protein [Anaerolineae bacterium]
MTVIAQIVSVEETMARLLLYRFLGLGYTYPETALLEVLQANETWDQLTAADEVLGLGIGPTLADLQTLVESYAGDGEQLLTDLQIEHTYLFISAVPHVPASPYESAYTNRGLLMGEPVSQVLRAYREAGLLMNKDYDALPDHMAAELEFMFYLVQQEAESSQSGDEDGAGVWQDRQRSFLREHLLRWGPSFLKEVTASARQLFYGMLAALTEAWFRSEEQRLRVTL